MPCIHALSNSLSTILKSPLFVASAELGIYVSLCSCIIIRYRHHVFHSVYKGCQKRSSPTIPVEILILMTLSVCLFTTNLISIITFHSEATGNPPRRLFDDLSVLMFLVIAILDWREERHFGQLVQHYWERKSAALEGESATPATSEKQVDSADATSIFPWSILRREPSASNVYVQYQIRGAIKALLGYAALVIAQLDLLRLERGMGESSSMTRCVGISMTLGGAYMIRTTILFVQMLKFRRSEMTIRI